MIKQIFVENDFRKNLKRLSPLKRAKYGAILDKLNKDSNEYILGVDVANPDFGDQSVVTYFTQDHDGTLICQGTKKL
jgi:mRNA-degrading endonuclease RelE of RelBE toxin-antitoxin system